MKPAPPEGTLAGHYAGPVTRLAAYALDASISVGLYGVTLAVIAFCIDLIVREDVTLPAKDTPLWAFGLVVWLFLYYFVSWAVAYKTIGKATLGLAVVQRDGSVLTVRQAFVRTLAYPLSWLILGLGFIGIVIGDERRALHDVIAGTTVVYDWDARAARWRFLSRRNTVESIEQPSEVS